MRKSFVLAGLLGLSAVVGSAAIITSVDSFNTTIQFVRSPNASPCGGPDTNTTAAPEAVGGQRTIAAGGNASGCAQADTNFTEAGAFSANLPGTNTGLFTVIWNNGLDADFLGGFSFFAKQDALAPPEAPSSVFFTACTAANGLSGCTTSTTATVGSTAYANYSVNFTGGLLQNIAFIKMSVNGGPGRDVFVDFVNADVPEPGTFALAGGALLVLGMLRRRSA